MEKTLITVFEDINKKLEKTFEPSKRNKYQSEISGLIEEYNKLDIPDFLMDTYESLVKKGKELLKESNIKDEGKLKYYLRYCGAAVYDFKQELKPLNTIMKSFLLTSILFFVLAPQFFSFILPLIFVIPIYMGLRGMRKRVLNGLMMGVSVVPMAILVSTVWLRNAYLTMGNLGSFVASIAKQYGFSLEFTQNLVYACIGLSVVMFVSSLVLLVSAIKYRRMFI